MWQTAFADLTLVALESKYRIKVWLGDVSGSNGSEYEDNMLLVYGAV